jgi:bacteriocin-like protein
MTNDTLSTLRELSVNELDQVSGGKGTDAANLEPQTWNQSTESILD